MSIKDFDDTVAKYYEATQEDKNPVRITSDRDIVDNDYMTPTQLSEALKQIVKYAAMLEEKRAEQRKEDNEISIKTGD